MGHCALEADKFFSVKIGIFTSKTHDDSKYFLQCKNTIDHTAILAPILIGIECRVLSFVST